MKDPARLGRLHVITDVVLQSRFTHTELGRIAARAGADTVQYRDKRSLSAAQRVAQATSLRDAILGVPLVINDHVDVALACGAWGVHLGREDTAPELARRRLGRTPWIGATANGLDEACRLDRQPIDYLGVGPVFGTRSKARPAAALGLTGLRRIVQAVDKPVIAIGGIEAQRVAEVLEAGAHGIAVLSAVACRPDPAREVARFREQIDRCAAALAPSAPAGGER